MMRPDRYHLPRLVCRAEASRHRLGLCRAGQRPRGLDLREWSEGLLQGLDARYIPPPQPPQPPQVVPLWRLCSCPTGATGLERCAICRIRTEDRDGRTWIIITVSGASWG